MATAERIPSEELPPRKAFDRAIYDCILRMYGTVLPKDHVDDVAESYRRLYPEGHVRAARTGEEGEGGDSALS